MWRERLSERSEGIHTLVACVDGEVVGDLTLETRPAYWRRRHVGQIGMAVRDDLQGRGVGTALIEAACALVQQVEERGYNPPRRERILEWQGQQDFPICPDPDDPDACNVYNELTFPDEMYKDIQQYREEKA
jgi:GNAT superfamily N-acetyltransferase